MNPESFSLPAFAKVNLFLRVAGKRKDGFHDLCTVFQTISLSDRLSFAPGEDIILTCENPEIPLGSENLIVKAAYLLQRACRKPKGAAIHLSKRIPSPGGLGGGSADCAMAILGLAKLWELNLAPKELEAIGGELGSDVPFFFHGGRAIGLGRGNEILPLGDEKPWRLIVIAPGARIETPRAFALLGADYLTNDASKSILEVCRNEAERHDLRHCKLVNEFESPVFRIEPGIKRAKDKLLELGVVDAQMTGSGASVFGIFDNELTRLSALDELKQELSWKVYPAEMISRDEYRKSLEKVADLLPQ